VGIISCRAIQEFMLGRQQVQDCTLMHTTMCPLLSHVRVARLSAAGSGRPGTRATITITSAVTQRHSSGPRTKRSDLIGARAHRGRSRRPSFHASTTKWQGTRNPHPRRRRRRQLHSLHRRRPHQLPHRLRQARGVAGGEVVEEIAKAASGAMQAGVIVRSRAVVTTALHHSSNLRPQ